MYKYLKLHLLIKSDRLKFFGLWMAHMLKMRHLSLRLDPVIACNLSCLMCYFSDSDYRRNNKGKFEPGQLERIAEIMFPSALQVVLGCATEPTLYKDYVSVIKKAREKGVPYISITTNGQLITKEKITELIETGLNEITLSVHGVSKEMYEKFMPGANYEKLILFLENLKAEKERLGKKQPKLRINYTANPENVYELKNFLHIYGKYDIDVFQVRPVMEIGGVYNELFEKEKDKTEYREAVEQLRVQCRQTGISLLANVGDISYSNRSEKSSVLEAVYRYISPDVLWERDFDWKNEDYYAYCKRIGWPQWLLSNVFSRQRTKENEESFLKKYSGKYEMIS